MIIKIIEWVLGFLAEKLGTFFVKKIEESEHEQELHKEAQAWADKPADDDDFAKRLRSLKSYNDGP